MKKHHSRHAVSRARFFLELAKGCKFDERDEFEAYLEAAIVFARTALHRLQSQYEKHPNWKPWWNDLLLNPAVLFFRRERNWILKEGPPKIGQIVRLGGEAPKAASELYYYEDPQTPATETVEKHLKSIERLVLEAEDLFE